MNNDQLSAGVQFRKLPVDLDPEMRDYILDLQRIIRQRLSGEVWFDSDIHVGGDIWVLYIDGEFKLYDRNTGTILVEHIIVNQTSQLSGISTSTAADKTADYQMLETDDVISIDASSNTVTITLEALPADGRMARIACSDSTFTADIDLNGSTFYSDATNIQLYQEEMLVLHYNGTEWRLG